MKAIFFQRFARAHRRRYARCLRQRAIPVPWPLQYSGGVEYLGHWIDAHGVHAAPSKVEATLVEAIQHAPITRNVTELHSFLGMIN